MAWVYDRARHAYISGDGKALSHADTMAIRNAIADGMTEESASLARQLLDDIITLAQWAADFAKLLVNGITAGFLFGHGGTATMDEEANGILDSLIADQHAFAKAWLPELAQGLNDGSATVEGVAARSALYSGGAVQSFEVGRSQDWQADLPYYPADGGESESGEPCVCFGNCRCSWVITEDDDAVTAAWVTAGDSSVCPGCEERGNEYGPDSPFTQSKAAA